MIWFITDNNILQLLPEPASFHRSVSSLVDSGNIQYKHLRRLSTKLGRQFRKHEFLIKRSSFSQFLTFSMSKFFLIIHLFFPVSTPSTHVIYILHCIACLSKERLCCWLCVWFIFSCTYIYCILHQYWHFWQSKNY